MTKSTTERDITTAPMVTCTVVLPCRYLKLLRRIAAVRWVRGGLANGRRPSISSVMREILDPAIPALEAELEQTGVADIQAAEYDQPACGCASGD